MAVTKQQKADILADLTEKFKNATSIGFAATNTLTVAEFGDLRNALREVDASYTIAKKTLIKIALKDALNIEVNLDDLPGQIGAVCSNDDAVAGLGKVNDLVKKTKGEKVEWAVSIFEGELKDNESTKAIAGMDSRETLLGRLVGSMQSPLSGLARFFDAAAKEVEAKGVDVVGKLEGEAKAEEAPAKEEAPKVEEKKEEVKTEEATPTKEEKSESDDLTKVEGIGPKTAEALIAAWVTTYAELSKKTAEEITAMISEVKGSHVTDTWPKQAEMAAAWNWDELKKWQDELDGGKPAE